MPPRRVVFVCCRGRPAASHAHAPDAEPFDGIAEAEKVRSRIATHPLT